MHLLDRNTTIIKVNEELSIISTTRDQLTNMIKRVNEILSYIENHQDDFTEYDLKELNVKLWKLRKDFFSMSGLQLEKYKDDADFLYKVINYCEKENKYLQKHYNRIHKLYLKLRN